MLKRNGNSFGCFGKQKKIINTWLWMIFLYGLIVVLVSCAAPRPESSVLSCNIPPLILQEKIKTILEASSLNLRIISVYEGRIETEFEESLGEFHGILWGKKRWQKRIKYIITIRPGWNNTERSEVSIYAEIEHRVNEHYPWEHKEYVYCGYKISEILRRISEINK